jgi:prepilin-type N-terminal cleavage/methylation domain-containing protein
LTRRGFTLLEVVVALTVLAVTLAGVVAVQHTALMRWNRALLERRARLDLQALADSVDRGDVAPAGEAPRPWGAIRWGTAGPGVELRALTPGDTLPVGRLWTAGAGGP